MPVRESARQPSQSSACSAAPRSGAPSAPTAAAHAAPIRAASSPRRCRRSSPRLRSALSQRAAEKDRSPPARCGSRAGRAGSSPSSVRRPVSSRPADPIPETLRRARRRPMRRSSSAIEPFPSRRADARSGRRDRTTPTPAHRSARRRRRLSRARAAHRLSCSRMAAAHGRAPWPRSRAAGRTGRRAAGIRRSR